jgi:hypothetical protein
MICPFSDKLHFCCCNNISISPVFFYGWSSPNGCKSAWQTEPPSVQLLPSLGDPAYFLAITSVQLSVRSLARGCFCDL